VIGTTINVFAILLGGGLGLLFGSRFSENIRRTVVSVIGLFTLAIGMQMFLKTENAIVVLVGLLFGAIVGELMQIEEALTRLGNWLQEKFTSPKERLINGNRFVKGFLTASLVFSIGPMAILGSIQDGLTGDYNLLVIKSILDGFASLAFAASLGVGVLFSALIILIYQGSISLLAGLAQTFVTTGMINEMTATGGVLLAGIAISNLLEIKPIRVGNVLPALFITPLLVQLLSYFRF
jgi:uncharacterized membrane protein YqgA involved in biofilm formation